MTLPDAWPVVEVRVGPYFGTDGRPLEGERVTFEPRVDRIILLDDTTVVRRITSVTLDAAGEGVAELPVSDDPDTDPNGWTWQVREKFRHGETFDIEVLTSDVAAGIDLADQAPIAPEVPHYPTSLARRVDGVEDHGDVTGTLLLDPADGYHVFDATGPTVVELGNPPGYSVAFKAVTGADDVTVEGLDDLTLSDDQWATFVYYRDGWNLAAAGASGGGTVEPVTDPPTQPGAITVDPTADGYNLSWVASTVAAGYEVQLDGGTWVDSGANLTHAFTALSPGSSHSGAVRAYNSVGARSTAQAWGPVSTDSVTLHDLLLSMDPAIYVRTTEGSIQDYSRTPATWTANTTYGSPGTLPTDYTGPPLTPDDSGSIPLSLGKKAKRPSDGLLTGATAFTQMVVGGMPPDATSGGGGNPFFYGDGFYIPNGQTGTEGYQAHQPGGVHTWFTVWDPATYSDNNAHRFIDGDPAEKGETGFGGGISAPSSPLPAPSPDFIFLGGNTYAGGGMEGYSAYSVIFDRALTPEERVALATAAGTLGNPAGGTLT